MASRGRVTDEEGGKESKETKIRDKNERYVIRMLESGDDRETEKGKGVLRQ